MVPDSDITILGGGPVGTTLALLLARLTPRPERIVLCRPERAPVGSPAADDPRVMALNHGSRILLQSLGAWPEGGADIADIHVSQRGRLGRTHISQTDFGVDALGTVQSYAAIMQALADPLAASGVTVRAGTGTVVSQDDTAVHLIRGVSQDAISDAVPGGGRASAMQGDAAWTSAAVVQAEGGTFDHQEAKDVHRNYDQHAVLATVTAERPRQGWAFERFTREGPLALLPFPGHPGAGGRANASGRYALVWCCQPDRAAALAAMNDDAFAAELNATFGTRLGMLSVAGPRHNYPLGLNVKKHVVDRRIAVIGNAAQTLHPVAGQGLNLGLRDAARLAQALAPALRQTGGDPRPLLAQYAKARRTDRWLTAGLTDLMPRIFATGLSPVEHACGLALLTLDLSRTVRTPLARQMMEGSRA